MAYNKVILEGNLSKDVEVRYTQSGTAIASTAIAVNKRYKAASGEQKEEVLFVDLVIFGRTAEVANQYLRKGSHVLIDGSLKLEQWTDRQGNKRSKHVVSVESLRMLGSREGGQPVNNQGGGYAAVQNRQPQQAQQQQQGHE